MQSANEKHPKIDERTDDTERGVRPRLESGYELTAHRSTEPHSIGEYVDAFVDPIASADLDPFDRALIDSFAFDGDDLVVDDTDFLSEGDEDDTIRMERPTFGPPKK